MQLQSQKVDRPDIYVGASGSLEVVISEELIRQYADLFGDHNPIHLDVEFAKSTRFGRPIAHGLITASYIGTLFGTRFPGPGCVYLSQTLQFRAPVFAGDRITVTATVMAMHASKPIITLSTCCKNQEGTPVIEGEAVLVLDVQAVTRP